MTGALSDIRVIELGNLVAGPYASRLLADAGAEVIKVEPPEGDAARSLGPFPADEPDPDWSALFAYLNWNKLGVVLDLEARSDVEQFEALIAMSDVLIVNLSVPDIDRLDIRQERLKRFNPCLIVTTITPFGLTGPKRGHIGDDLVAVASGGLAYASPGVPDLPADPYLEPPLRANTPMGDLLAGLQAATATMVALAGRGFDGQGVEVDVSEQEAVAMVMAWEIAHASYHEAKTRDPVMAGAQPNAYLPCEDGHVVIVGFLEHHWRGLLKTMGSPDWGEWEVFATAADRALNWDALEPLLTEWTMRHTGAAIADMAQRNGVPCFPAHGVGEMMGSEQVQERAYLQSWQAPTGDLLQLSGFPIRMSETPWERRSDWPRLGEHTDLVFRAWLGRIPAGGAP